MDNNELRLMLLDIKSSEKMPFYDIAQQLGITNSYLSKLINGDKALSSSFMAKLQGEFPEYFVKYFGAKENIIEKIRQSKIGPKQQKGILVLPIKVQAGYSRHLSDPIYYENLTRTYIPNNPYDGDNYMMAEMEGASMEYIDENGRPAGFPEGAWLIFEKVPQELWRTGLKKYYVHLVITETLFTIKRILQDNPDEIVLSPDNEDYPQERIHLNDVKEIWLFKRRLDWNAPPPRKHEIKV